MELAKVIGNLVSSHKNETLNGKKLLIVQPLDAELNPFGEESVAVDVIGAGVGDIVVVISEGKSARTVSKAESPIAPIELAVAGIVDSVKTDKGYKRIK